MSTYEYEKLDSSYGGFENPVAVITVNGKDISQNKNLLVVNDLEVDLTSGYEASTASFCIYNTFQKDSSSYRFDSFKEYVQLGAKVEISLGYLDKVRKVFLGVITRVNFLFENQEYPYVQVTAMDVKGIMMSCCFAKQMQANVYSEAVKEVFGRLGYSVFQNNDMLDLEIDETPDKKEASQNEGGTSAKTIEMVNESDYEFVVRAAKRYNYEFFSSCGKVYFRKAKKNKEILIEIGPECGLLDFDITYDITGMVVQVEARGMDPGKGKLLQARQKFNNKLSTGRYAKSLLKGSELVYIDPTITSKAEAQYRVESLAEQISYRFGSIFCTCTGLSELEPGRFLKIKTLGGPAENVFYIHEVRHCLNRDGSYVTYLHGQTCALDFNPGR